jgi:hypothetical protein
MRAFTSRSAAKSSDLGFEQIVNGLHGYRPSAGLAGKSWDNARTNFGTRTRLKAFADEIRQDATQALRAFLGEMFRDFEDVFVEVDSGSHALTVAA